MIHKDLALLKLNDLFFQLVLEYGSFGLTAARITTLLELKGPFSFPGGLVDNIGPLNGLRYELEVSSYRTRPAVLRFPRYTTNQDFLGRWLQATG